MRAERIQKNKAAILVKIKDVEVKSVIVNYSGSGDDGQIDGVEIEGGNEPAPVVTIWDSKSDWVPDGDNGGRWNETEFEKETGLADAIEELCYELIDQYHSGCFNNDGADGRFEFNLETGMINWTHNDFHVESDTTEHEI